MRIKNAAIRKTRRKKLFKRAKGFRGARGTTLRQTNEAVLKAEPRDAVREDPLFKLLDKPVRPSLRLVLPALD